MEQQIRFCTAPDGVRVAYATVGEGPPLVMSPGWLSHLEAEWGFVDTRAFLEKLARGRLLVRYDKRGMGLSDWEAEDYSMEARVSDLGAVVDAVGLDEFDLLGISEGGAICIEYVVRNPARVKRLVLYGSYMHLPTPPALADALLSLIRNQWGMGSAALATIFVPGGDPAETAAFTTMQRIATNGHVAARLIEAIMAIDVTDSLKDVKVPTLVVHRKGDAIHPFNVARELASAIPDARLQPLEGDIYPPWWGDSQAVLDAIDAFLGGEKVGSEPELEPPVASAPRVITILFTDMEGSTNLTQRIGDAGAQEVLRSHNTIVRDALKAHGGAEVKHTGDGIMAQFWATSNVLSCAVAIQRAFAEYNKSNPDTPIRVRIGLNAGEPIAEEHPDGRGDLFGTSVDLASRICGHAEPGQIVVSNVVRELAAGKEFLFADLGETELRGFEDPVRLFEVRWREDD